MTFSEGKKHLKARYIAPDTKAQFTVLWQH